jgi:hypothetical protein
MVCQGWDQRPDYPKMASTDAAAQAAPPGYDGVTWWCRGSLAQSTMDVSGAQWPTAMVGHGDGMSGDEPGRRRLRGVAPPGAHGTAVVVDGSLLGTAVWFNGLTLVGTQFGPPPRRATAVHLLFLGDADRDFTDLCQHLGRQDLATDARFTSPAGRSASRAELMAILDETFADDILREIGMTGDQIAALRSAGFVA